MHPQFLALAATLLSLSLARSEMPTALGAIKLLPKGDARRVALIAARDGTPGPERWYILTHDEKSENGLREFVVAGGEVVASRTISQFAESLAPTDVIGGDAVKIDSDRAAKLAQQYALANSLTVATLNYELKKEGAAAAPLWTVTCVDEDGKDVAQLIVSATRGNVISHEGFAVEPAAQQTREKLRTQVAPVVAPEPGGRRAEEKRHGFFQRVGGSVQKLFTGKDAGNR